MAQKVVQVEEKKVEEEPVRRPITASEIKRLDSLKGPKPKGTKKFKAVKQDEPEVPPEELSEN